MKLSWFAKELLSLSVLLFLGIGTLIWAIIEASNSSYQYSIVVIGFAVAFIPVLIDLIISYRKGTLFIKDQKTFAEKKVQNRKIAKLSLVPGFVFAVTFVYFTESLKVVLLSMLAGYLVPYSIAVLIHFFKNHEEIEKIDKRI